MEKKIFSKTANIESNKWELKDVKIIVFKDGIFKETTVETLFIKSIYDYEKLVNLFNNSDTFSFVEILIDFKSMINKGYNQEFLKQSLHSMMTLPFYLFI